MSLYIPLFCFILYCDGSGIFAYALIIPLPSTLNIPLQSSRKSLCEWRSSERVLFYRATPQNIISSNKLSQVTSKKK